MYPIRYQMKGLGIFFRTPPCLLYFKLVWGRHDHFKYACQQKESYTNHVLSNKMGYNEVRRQWLMFCEVWRSNVQERLWHSKGLLWNVLMCLSVFCPILRVCFVWNWCDRSLTFIWSYFSWKRPGKTPQGPTKGPWGKTQLVSQGCPNEPHLRMASMHSRMIDSL